MAGNLKQLGLASHNCETPPADSFDFAPAEGGETEAIRHGATALAWARVDAVSGGDVSGDVSGDGVDDVAVGVDGGGPHARMQGDGAGLLGIEAHRAGHFDACDGV